MYTHRGITSRVYADIVHVICNTGSTGPGIGTGTTGSEGDVDADGRDSRNGRDGRDSRYDCCGLRSRGTSPTIVRVDVRLRGEKVALYGIPEGTLGIEGEPKAKGERRRPWGRGVHEREGRRRRRDGDRGWLSFSFLIRY